MVRFSGRMDGDGLHDGNTAPGVIQSNIDLEGRRHWANVECFTECKTDRNQLGDTLMRLARYARTTLINQIYRLCFRDCSVGTGAGFVRFDRGQILHSPPIDLSQDFQKFALAAAGLFVLKPRKFGYNTDSYYLPPPTGKPDDHSESKELRVKICNKCWRAGVMCQRKCLIGRATLVLLLARVKNKKQRVVLKLIWKDESRTDEGESLKLFKTKKRFFLRLSEADLPSDLSNTSGSTSRDSRLQSAELGILQSQQTRLELAVDQVLGVVVMDEGIGLWRIKRLLHLLRVMRDGLVGSIHKTSCTRILARGTSSVLHLWILMWRARVLEQSESTLVDLDLDSNNSSTVIEEDVGSVSNELSLTSGAGKIDALMYEEYCKQQHDGVKYIGKLYNLEFMVNPKRDEKEPRGSEKTGTPAFIAVQLLLATICKPVQYTYLHDLESFFWVLLMTKLCNPNDQSLGKFKGLFIDTLVDSGDTIVELDDGWDQAGGAVHDFAEFLYKSIYTKQITKYPKFVEALPKKDEEDPWLDIKPLNYRLRASPRLVLARPLPARLAGSSSCSSALRAVAAAPSPKSAGTSRYGARGPSEGQVSTIMGNSRGKPYPAIYPFKCGYTYHQRKTPSCATAGQLPQAGPFLKTTMPPNTIMRGGVLPLDAILNVLPTSLKSSSTTSQSRPPSELVQSENTLLLDSTRLISGLLRSSNSGGAVEYVIATDGPRTVVTHPARSRNVAVVEWKAGKTRVVVEDDGVRLQLCLGEWLDVSRWGHAKTRVFRKWGRNPEIRWSAKLGEWEATDTHGQVLAVLVSRRGALGTRIEITQAGTGYCDAIVLTALLTVTHEEEWRWYSYMQNRRDAVSPPTQAEQGLPTYREAPFTRPLGPLLVPQVAEEEQEEELGPPSDRPLVLELSSRNLLNGTFCEESKSMVSIRTLGPRTTLSRHVYTGTGEEVGVREVAVIEWAEGKVVMGGREIPISDVTDTKKPMFGSRCVSRCWFPFADWSRKDYRCTVGGLSCCWSEVSRSSTASIYLDRDMHVRYTCRDERPLGVLTRYLKRRGTRLEVTPQGHGLLVGLLVSALVVTCHGEWKKVAGVGVGITEREQLVLGEEMVSDLDGWAGPVELMRLRQ
ncbi:hypothetical protein CTheo_2828 [Ceratobasidium theobromae]|uniref:Fungal-type protein kinase domain-containing protein n=1 Tax=Ceratobasidium theobromae TaxID=1582974 RepID=A0A5N5QQ59_9AGAM|nr:hypothetical protein CTheo_2828 [Ceratobasidium theobromae]